MSRRRWRSRARKACRCCRAAAAPRNAARPSARALVLDCSKYMDSVVALDAEARRVRVQPGRRHGAAQRAAAAAQAVVPGRCLDRRPRDDRRHDRQQQLRRALDPLRQHGPQCARDRRDPRRRHRGALRRGPRQFRSEWTTSSPSAIATWCATCARCTAARPTRSTRRFPKLLRRVGGYNIDMIDPTPATTWRICWSARRARSPFSARSSSTCSRSRRTGCSASAISRASTRRWTRRSTSSSWARAAVELVDRTMIELARDNPGVPPGRRPLCPGRAGSDPADRIRRRRRRRQSAPAEAARRVDGRSRLRQSVPMPVVEATDPAFQSAVWDVRKEGLNIMMSMKGDGKPISFIEDCAVRLEDLAEYTDRLTQVFRQARHRRHLVRACLGRHAACAAGPQPEAGTRRQTDARDRRGSLRDGARIQGVAFGRARRRAGALRVSRADVRLAPRARLRGGQGHFRPGRAVQSRQDRPAAEDGRPHACSASSRATGRCRSTPRSTGRNGAAFASAAEMCNNNGACRKSDPGVMCPSYRATGDEQHLTRGRANTLAPGAVGPARPRRAGLGRDARDAGAVRLVQGLQARMPDRRRHGAHEDRVPAPLQEAARPLARATALIAYLPRYAPQAARLAPLHETAQPDARPGRARRAGARLQRAPADAANGRRSPYRGAAGSGTVRRQRRGASREVVLLVDTFNRYFEPENAARRRAGADPRRLSRHDAGAGGRKAAVLRPHLSRRRAGRRGAQARRAACSTRWRRRSPPAPRSSVSNRPAC